MKTVTLALLFTAGAFLLATNVVAQTWQPVGPSPRLSHSAVLDTTSNSAIVFGGGQIPENGGRINLNDVWRLNANLTWTALHPTGTAPQARLGHTAVYDSVNNRMTVFGGGEGSTSPCANDVWVLTNANGKGVVPAWTQLSPSGSAPAPRAQHGAAFDPASNTMIVYGGQNCFSTIFGDVWVLSNANGLGGTPTWTQLSPVGGGPGAREVQGGVAYDSANNRFIVFGGSTANNDVWVLSSANGQGGTPTWTQLSPAGTLPPARAENSTVYDPKSNRLTIYGGADAANNILQDTWVLTNANGLGGTPTWTQSVSLPLLPAGRFAHTAVYNSKTNKMTIYGGLASISGPSVIANDVWVLSHANGQ